MDQRSDGVWLKVPVPAMPIIYDPDHLLHFFYGVECRAGTVVGSSTARSEVGCELRSCVTVRDVVKTQATDFANAHAVNRAEQNRAATSHLNWRDAVDAGKKALHLFP
jgi:hypothetical protein